MDDLTTKLAELQGVIAKGGMTRLSDSETIRQAIEAMRLYDAAKAQPVVEPLDSTTSLVDSVESERDRLRVELSDTKDALAALCRSVNDFNLGRTMSPKSASGTSEPIAWRLKSPPGSTYTAVFNPGKPDAQTLEYWGRNGGEIEYAYAAPVAQAEPRKPLTDEQIKARKPICADSVSFRAGVRSIELDLGIYK